MGPAGIMASEPAQFIFWNFSQFPISQKVYWKDCKYSFQMCFQREISLDSYTSPEVSSASSWIHSTWDSVQGSGKQQQVGITISSLLFVSLWPRNNWPQISVTWHFSPYLTVVEYRRQVQVTSLPWASGLFFVVVVCLILFFVLFCYYKKVIFTWWVAVGINQDGGEEPDFLASGSNSASFWLDNLSKLGNISVF